MKVTGQDRRALMLGAAGVGVILLWVGLVEPLLSRWERAGKSIQQARREIERLSRGASAAEQARQAVRELEALAWVHPSETSLQRQTALVIQHLGSLPAYRRLTISQVQGQAPQRTQSVIRARVSLQFRGRPAEVQRLLEEMETARPRLVVDALSLRLNAKNPNEVEGELQVSICAVVLKGDAA